MSRAMFSRLWIETHVHGSHAKSLTRRKFFPAGRGLEATFFGLFPGSPELTGVSARRRSQCLLAPYPCPIDLAGLHDLEVYRTGDTNMHTLFIMCYSVMATAKDH